MAKLQITFSEAKRGRNETGLRQAYLNTIMQSCPASVSKLIYDPSGLLTVEHTKKLFDENFLAKEDVESIINHLYNADASASVIFSYPLIGLKKSHPIFVYGRAFAGIDKEASILSLILDHEVLHADDLMHGIKLPHGIVLDYGNFAQFSPGTPTICSEIRAYRNQLENLGARGIDRNSTKEIFYGKIEYFIKLLHSTVPKSDIEKLVISAF